MQFLLTQSCKPAEKSFTTLINHVTPRLVFHKRSTHELNESRGNITNVIEIKNRPAGNKTV
jgi:hypothetical protein